jgi:hypothetical protein
VRSRPRRINRFNDRANRLLNSRPAGRQQCDGPETPTRQILLVFDAGIGCDEHLVALAFGRVDQLAIG